MQYREYVRTLFRKLDKDHSGGLDLQEFTSFYRKVLHSESARRRFAARALEKVRAREAMDSRALEAFMAVDTDASGKVSAKELGAMLRVALGEVHASLQGGTEWQAFVDDLVRRGDKDDDDEWNLEEFTHFFAKCLSSEAVTAAYERKVILRLNEQRGWLEFHLEIDTGASDAEWTSSVEVVEW